MYEGKAIVTMDKIKILTITTSGLKKKDGISTIILDSYEELDIEKYQIDITVAGEYDPGLVKAFENIEVCPRYLPERKRELGNYVRELRSLLLKEKYDVVYVHGSSAIIGIELFVAKMCGCKVRIAHSHSSSCEHKKMDKLIRPIFYRSYTKALACSDAAGKWMYRNHPYEIIKNGRSTELYQFEPVIRNRMRDTLGLKEDTLAIGHVGNFYGPKNQEYLIHMMKELIKKNSNTRLYFMGEGETRQQVEALTVSEGLESYVVFTGSISDVDEMLQAMDVMALPSFYEGLPLVVVEWQMAGLPCVVSERVSKECAYTDLVHFLPLESGHAVWADKILELAGNDRDRSSRDAVDRAADAGFDLRRNTQRLEEIFAKGTK